jgi:hypothetical protein
MLEAGDAKEAAMLMRTVPYAGRVFDLLIEEHRVILGLFAALRALPAHAVAERRAGLAEVGRLLRAHARAEQEIVFPALDGSHELGHHVREDRRQHAEIDADLCAIEALDPAGTAWAQEVAALAALVARHMADEEEILIPGARRVIGDTYAETLLLEYQLDRDLTLGG